MRRSLQFLAFGLIFGAASVAWVHAAWAVTSGSGVAVNPAAVRSEVSRVLGQAYPGSRIEIPQGGIVCPQGAISAPLQRVALSADSGQGLARLQIEGGNVRQECEARFSAHAQAWLAQRRVQPGQKLQPSDFQLSEVEVSRGLIRDQRGLLLSAQVRPDGLEARQTLLEGQPLLSNTVQRVPDVKRGEVLQLKVVSGQVTLTAQAVAEEPAYLNESVRLSTAKTKRVMQGKLVAPGQVEVRL